MAKAWTGERTALLTKLWHDGRTASQVAAEIGQGISRNAVIGKLHRLGVVREVVRPANIEAPAQTVQQVEPEVDLIRPEPVRVEEPVPESAQPARYRNLGEALVALPAGPVCRWSMDMDDRADIRFCGALATHAAHRKVSRPVYCACHHQRSTAAGTRGEQAAFRAFPAT